MAAIGERIREVRQAKRPKLSGGKLAAKVGLSAQALNEIELHGAIPRSDNLAAIARALDVSADYLLGLDAPAPPPWNGQTERRRGDRRRGHARSGPHG